MIVNNITELDGIGIAAAWVQNSSCSSFGNNSLHKPQTTRFPKTLCTVGCTIYATRRSPRSLLLLTSAHFADLASVKHTGQNIPQIVDTSGFIEINSTQPSLS